jgi:hypothetical protein
MAKKKPSFFSIAELKQPVNQWICIAFVGVLCFWVVLYYFTEKTKIIAEGYSLSSAASIVSEY